MAHGISGKGLGMISLKDALADGTEFERTVAGIVVEAEKRLKAAKVANDNGPRPTSVEELIANSLKERFQVTWFDDVDQSTAKTFADELPWLNKSHRALVGIASEIRGRQIAGEEVGVKAMSLLRMILGSMGATPADSSKVRMPEEQDDEDPSTKYFS
jgi:hypothetical protein